MAFKMKGFTYAAGTGGAKKMKTAVFQKKEEEFKTYRKAYEDADKSKYKTYEEFEKAAKAYNKKTYGTTEPTKAANEASKAMGEKVTKDDLKKNDYSAAIRMDKAKSDKKTGSSKSKAGEESLQSTMTREVKKPRKNKSVTTTKKSDAKGSTTKITKEKGGIEGKIKDKIITKDDATGKVTKEKDKYKDNKTKFVKKEYSDGKVTTTKRKIVNGRVKDKTKERKQFSETKVGKFLSGKKKKKDDSSMKNYKKGYYKK